MRPRAPLAPFAALALSISLGLSMSACGGGVMVKETERPEPTASPERAMLVIYRGTAYGGAVKIDNYLDNQFIGQTKGKSYFLTAVEPGTHYIIADAENDACAKVTFEPGKVYYLLQGIYPGVMFARTGFEGSDPQSFAEDFGDLTYYTVATDQELPTMSQKDYQRTVADHEQELAEEPDRHKDTLNLQGY